MVGKKHLTPFKALIMSLQLLPNIDIPEERMNLIFDKKELEAIQEHIKQNGELE